MFIGQIWTYQSKGNYCEHHELFVIFKPTAPVSENSFSQSETVAVLDKKTLSLQSLVRLGLKIVIIPQVEVNYTQFKAKQNKLEDINPKLCARLNIG